MFVPIKGFTPLRLRLTACLCFTALFGIALLGSSVRSYGQAYGSSLTGVVTDPQGGAVPNAQVELRNQATAETRVTQTAGDGRYTFAGLKPATYTLTVTVPGFETYTHTGLVLEAQIASSVDVPLKIGQAKATVTVSGAVPRLDTQSATQEATLNSTMIAQLPSGVQSPLPLVLGLAGTTTLGMAGSGNMTDQVQDQNLSRFAIAGGRDMGNLILLDGAPDTAADWGGLLVSPSSSSTQEVQVIRNTYDAQFGKTGGGVVSMVTKSGTDRFHGEAYGYLRNDNLDATAWSGTTYVACDPSLTARQCSDMKKPEFKREEFGGSIGGPIWRSKHLYFMGSYDGLREPASSAFGPTTVPTMAERGGDFSQAYNSDGTLEVLYNPFTTSGNFTRQPFDAACIGVKYPNTCPGNVIPQNLLNTVGQKIAGLFPMPNRPGDPITNANNYYVNGSANTINDHVDGRVDWAHNDRHSTYVRWSQRIRESNPTPDYFGNGATPVLEFNNPGYDALIGNTFTPSPTWVINVLIGSGRWSEGQGSPAEGKLTPASIGLSPADFQAQLIPPFSFDNYTSLGGGELRHFIRYSHTLQVDATKERGAHSIKFGTYVESALINDTDNFTGPPSYSPFSFSRCTTAAQPNVTCNDQGDAIASLLLGTGNGGGSSNFNPDLAMSMPYYGFYGQDTWRATAKLTLTLGLRYELQSGATERFNRWSLFDPNATNPLSQITGLSLKGNFVYANSSSRGLWPTDYHNFAPRVGLAYQITPKLVARAGFGIFYLPAQALIGFDNPGQDIGFSTSTPWLFSSPSNPFLPFNLISNPYPNGLTQPTGAGTDFTATAGQGIGQVWLTGPHPTPYKENWNLDFQYEFNPSSVLEVGYNGFGGRKLLFGNPAFNPDQLPDQYISLGNALFNPVANPFAGAVAQYPALANTILAGNTCPTTINAPSCLTEQQLLLPEPEYYYLTLTRSYPGATANFDSLWVQYTHRFSGGLQLLSSYQWSKALDDGSEDQGWELGGSSSPWRDYYNRKLEYSVSAHDVPQSFVTSLVYQLPVGRGKRFGSGWSGPVNAVAGGWQLSSIIRLTSGFPLSIEAPYSGAGSTGYPNLVSTHLVSVANRNPGPGGSWFNTCAEVQDQNGNYFQSGCGAGQQVAWVQTPYFTYGNAPRYISNLRTDWTRNVDFSLAKDFQATERMRLQFRADTFNLFNTPLFNSIGQFDTFLTDPSFGQVFGTGNSPREIQLGLRVMF